MVRRFLQAWSMVVVLPLFAQVLYAADELWPEYEDRCKTVVEQIAAGRFTELEADFTAEMKKAVPASTLAQLCNPLRKQLGEFDAIVAHRRRSTAGGGDHAGFKLWARFTKSKYLLEVDISFDKDGKIAGLLLTPTRETSPPANEVSEVPFADYETKTRLALPFHGEWSVVHGGLTAEQNAHAGNRNQRFAYDFWLADDTDARFRNDGRRCEDYLAFGQPVLAPGDGTVIQAIDGVEDNIPGRRNPYFVPGNLVVIDHQNGEYSFLGHFKQGSIRVQAGQRVKQGEPLGLCGNSGNSSEPHIHYHLANAPLMQDGDGLPARFRQITVDGKPATNVLPVRGERVSNLQEKLSARKATENLE